MKQELPLPAILSFDPVALHNEWAFLCACASPVSTPSGIESPIHKQLNWDSLLDLAEEHSVQGILAKRLEEIAFAGVPGAAREKLQARMRTQNLFTLSMTAELFRILQDFSRFTIDTLLVKGPLISLLAYGDPAIRSYVDLDLLLRHRDIPAATQRMLEMGFHSDVPQSAIQAGKVPGEYLFRRLGTQHIVELHTEHTFRYYRKPMPLEELFTRSRKAPLDGRRVPALGLEDEMVLNCIHGAKHFWEQLMWVSDIAALVTRHPELDWVKTKQAAAEVGAERMLRIGIQLAAAVLHSAIPSALRSDINKDRATEVLCRRIQSWLPYAGAAPRSLLARAMFRLQMAGGGATGAAYLMRLSLSPTQEDWVAGTEERKSWLRDALRRPFRLLRKYGSNE